MPQRRENMFECTNDRYCADYETFDSVDDLIAMCKECFGSSPNLRPGRERDGTEVWLDEVDEVVLRKVEAE